jgi:hypothetical protein
VQFGLCRIDDLLQMWHWVRVLSSVIDPCRVAGPLLALCGAAGCEGLFAQRGLPDDPLFINRKPLEARAVSAPPVMLVHAEPVPPTNPYFAQGHSTLATGSLRQTPEPSPSLSPDNTLHRTAPPNDAGTSSKRALK